MVDRDVFGRRLARLEELLRDLRQLVAGGRNHERLWEILAEELDQLEQYAGALVQAVGTER